MVGSTVSWTLNTNRDVADITSLGEGFQKQMATLVSGSGDLDCFFDVPQAFCGNDAANEDTPQYLHRSVIAAEIGANFKRFFLLKQQRLQPAV